MSKYNVGKTLFLQGLSEQELHGALVYEFRKIICKDFPIHFEKLIVLSKRFIII